MRNISEPYKKSKQVQKQVDKMVKEVMGAIMAKNAGKKWLYKAR